MLNINSKAIKSFIATVAVLAGSNATLMNSAEAINRYAVACIRNQTSTTITYSVQWGEGQWKDYRIAPGTSTSHWQKYDKPDKNRSDNLTIRFDSDLRPASNNVFWTTYSLNRKAAPEETCEYGKQYSFQYDGRSQRYIDLKAN